MKKGSTLFLRFAICFIAIIAFAGMIWFPQTEGRAANLDLVSVYTDPFIIYGYIGSIPFFVALYQALKLLGYVDKNKIFSQDAIKTVRNIKYCALAIIGFLVMAIFYIRLMAHGDDPAGPTMVGFVAIFASLVIATATAIFQKLLQNAVNIKSENDLTV
ncbi:hypothetical protein A3E13_02975 [Candidatus Woesebacteria bacterium RIFCSPHIGHO2_12_FULL_40_20]|nr:MAG: hypothetical protein A2692_03595 [Candidatus Woesebacteria bacterium RIFCSPHIGHO2_01_FULL_39_95]OGM37169.1 MAG: hypothetical protein A3E13_02975 [Candidatus Woesebacteria bacterium RIFCSPHIGHO2_12_FULL_40_20]OGM72118.1 MAG: hypothetical protein A3H19_06545 [Candidatus Woesebacteria bacterium RIFCSPLOWO2_12_FULL_39_9]